ncbi:5-carboxymethyl-2-hydroxymuconate Delta-isomerase [Cohaesibacter celericrescens]|uniref:5-carboxymethyl-2-hydroxymuconate isomerase n=1 Tax=Cohaesibacter celericrescens TaxID=2067669 RepID=A0A2N5XLG3_9HYPH|nr:5-carboxymethyl-2-hydroxymuconate Delta-isomerase [Cohaesibacter celericrescens]PLW75343.1 5-carboxymethyl-2-hydroxymuconate isomerase [Cohaesibacter celericrescens]
MPHAWIEYSTNFADTSEIATFADCVHAAMLETGIFPLAGIRIRVTPITDYIVADKHPDNGFVHLSLRIGEGRDTETRTKAADIIFERTSSHLKPLSDRARLAFAFEMQEIKGPHSYKMNNLRQYI